MRLEIGNAINAAGNSNQVGSERGREMTKEQWFAKGKELFGDDIMQWKFKCPSCGHVVSVEDFDTPHE